MMTFICREGTNSKKMQQDQQPIIYRRIKKAEVHCLSNGNGFPTREITQKNPFCPVIKGNCVQVEKILRNNCKKA